MIFKYNYINNEAKLLQKLVTHIVYDVWCNASGKTFSIEEITKTYKFRDKVNRTNTNLKEPIEKIFNICSNFTTQQIDYIKQSFITNNNIKDLCNNTVTPIFYRDLANNTTQEFVDEVKSFFNNLYKNVFNQQPFHINSHYNNFFQHNKKLCPFCGLTTLEKDSSNHRDDYDHYLPKNIYPFNAVNLKNLVPMCSDCNKKWKKVKNPIKDGTHSKKAFYYYGDIEPDYTIEIDITNIDLQNFDVNVILSSETMQEEVESWNRVFSLSQRYKDDYICHEQFGIAFIRSIQSKQLKAKTLGKTYDPETEIWELEDNLIANKNFLKIPFFHTCKREGLFN